MVLLQEITEAVERQRGTYGYHVTRKNNLSSIQKNGILPNNPDDMEDKKGVYFFQSLRDVQTALYQWLGIRIEEWEEENGEEYNEIVLVVDLRGLPIESAVEFEWMVPITIPPERIVKVLGPDLKHMSS